MSGKNKFPHRATVVRNLLLKPHAILIQPRSYQLPPRITNDAAVMECCVTGTKVGRRLISRPLFVYLCFFCFFFAHCWRIKEVFMCLIIWVESSVSWLERSCRCPSSIALEDLILFRWLVHMSHSGFWSHSCLLQKCWSALGQKVLLSMRNMCAIYSCEIFEKRLSLYFSATGTWASSSLPADVGSRIHFFL